MMGRQNPLPTTMLSSLNSKNKKKNLFVAKLKDPKVYLSSLIIIVKFLHT